MYENYMLQKVNAFYREFKTKEGKNLVIIEPGYIVNKPTFMIWSILDKEMNYRSLINELQNIIKNSSYEEIANITNSILSSLSKRKLISVNNTVGEILFNENKVIKMECELEKDYRTTAITQVDLVVTTECNFRCKHCFIKESNLSKATKLDVEKWKDIIDMLCEQGLISVVITGGEPLVYKDLPELLDYADTKGLKLQILTNGYLIDEQFVNRIKNYRNLIVQVSLDGSNSKTNNLQRNKNDAFSRTIENIKLLRSYNIEVITAMVLNKHNVGDIYDGSMIKLCEDLDVNVLAITPTVIKIENAKKNEEEFLAPYEILNVVNYINDINKTYDNKLIINVSAPPSVTYETSVSKVKKKRPRCRRGSNSFSIRPNGDICVCSDFMEVGYETYELGNIMTDDFSFLINELSKVSKRKLESINRIKVFAQSVPNFNIVVGHVELMHMLRITI